MIKGLFRFISGLSEKDKYEITGWAFSYFMTRNLTSERAVVEAVKKVRPDLMKEDGSVNLGRSALLDLQLRMKNML